MKSIPYSTQYLDEDDIAAVLDVLRSDYLTQGKMVPAFENALSVKCNSKYGIATNSATSALHIACLALDLKPGDYLWTSPTTFVASSNCGLYCGANIDFVDIDPATYNMSMDCLKAKLEKADKQGKLPKVVIPVHLCGQPCDMKEIHNLSQKYGFRIIEDASHAVGAKYKGNPVGNCEFSDITIFSFHPVKIITSGEGGMAFTNNPELAEKMVLLRSHGITSNKSLMSNRPSDEIWNYQQIDLGFNYRLTDIHASLGLSQVKKLDDFIKKRRVIASNYDAELLLDEVKLPAQHIDSYSSYHLYPIRISSKGKKSLQKHFYAELQKKKINVNLHYIPVYRQPYYEKLGFKAGYCPESEKYHKEALSIPIYPAMKEGDQQYVIETIKNISKNLY
jgi:UDP-4-amino-4,6-dideoxy-N-acetyl-beta-L-altrosamine transaminase